MVHLGQNIAKLRGIRRLTQKELAGKVGIAQPEYSKIEQKAEIDEAMLEIIAKALDVSTDAIKNFNEDAAINIISSTLNDNAGSINHFPIYNFNPIDKLVEAMEANRQLYERLLNEKDAVIALYKKKENT